MMVVDQNKMDHFLLQNGLDGIEMLLIVASAEDFAWRHPRLVI